jgi:hypothetical protein
MKLISGSGMPANNRAVVTTETARGGAHLSRETLGQCRLKDGININAFRLVSPTSCNASRPLLVAEPKQVRPHPSGPDSVGQPVESQHG